MVLGNANKLEFCEKNLEVSAILRKFANRKCDFIFAYTLKMRHL